MLLLRVFMENISFFDRKNKGEHRSVRRFPNKKAPLSAQERLFFPCFFGKDGFLPQTPYAGITRIRFKVTQSCFLP